MLHPLQMDLVGVNPFGRVFLRESLDSVDQDTDIVISIRVAVSSDICTTTR